MAMTSAEMLAQPRRHRRAAGLIRRAIETVRLWRARRRGRQELAGLDDRALHDLAMTRVDAIQECRKRFWQN
jgi:uncharacterized protein YjiS (DUF1127 family)